VGTGLLGGLDDLVFAEGAEGVVVAHEHDGHGEALGPRLPDELEGLGQRHSALQGHYA
jgi:hypothetical protein